MVRPAPSLGKLNHAELVMMLEAALSQVEKVRQALAILAADEPTRLDWSDARALDDGGPDYEDSAGWDEEYDSRSFADRIAEIGEGYEVGGRLTDEDVRIATGAY